MLNPRLLEDTEPVRQGLMQPFLIVEDALLPESAEELYNDLLHFEGWHSDDQSNFSERHVNTMARFTPEYTFQRKQIKLGEHPAPRSADAFFRYLNSPEVLKWASAISGRRCDMFRGSATIYRENDHIAEHNDHYVMTRDDGTTVTRALTFNYYLTKGWDPEWGGRFFWKTPGTAITPTFNTLVLFLVGPASHHHVEAVNKMARVPRMAITGWFHTVRTPTQHHERKLNLKL
jgi:Rps23 Pro-64 3,4-dihydroxylase Tpa1-like proline 4-hydroxylase